jgi:hypothetical protein
LNILISQKQVQRGFVYIAIRPALPWEGPDCFKPAEVESKTIL